MSTKRPLVGWIMGSLNDLKVLKPGMDLMEEWDLPYEVIVASAHRTPELVSEWVSGAEDRGLLVIIAAAGMAAHLPGVVAAHTLLPVIGLPIKAGALDGVDALYSIVQMPPGIPVATVGVDGAVNAAVLSLHILSLFDDKWHETLNEYRKNMPRKIEQQNVELRQTRPGAVWTPWDPDAVEGGEKEPDLTTYMSPSAISRAQGVSEAEASGMPPEEETGFIPNLAAEAARKKREIAAKVSSAEAETEPTPVVKPRRDTYVGRITISPDDISAEAVEQTVDCLLAGGIVALPTDTVYGLAVDATNPEAVRRLYAIKNRAPGRAVPLLVDSQRLLGTVVAPFAPSVRSLLEAFWPGPLTVIFGKGEGAGLDAVADGPTIGARLPDHTVPLSIIQELRRPLACTSANMSGKAEARTGDEIAQVFGDQVDLILDAGELEPASPSTVLDVTAEPFRILRRGEITLERLAAVAGDIIVEA